MALLDWRDERRIGEALGEATSRRSSEPYFRQVTRLAYYVMCRPLTS